MMAVLFFAATGVTLNHPDWLAAESTRDFTGKLPATWKTAQGVDWLVVAEYLRSAHGVRGTVGERTAEGTQGSLTFKAPGYAADCFIQMADGSYKLTESYQGTIGMLNDLHRGRDAGGTWALLIDDTLARVVVPRLRSRTKTSDTVLVSPATRLVATEENAT